MIAFCGRLGLGSKVDHLFRYSNLEDFSGFLRHLHTSKNVRVRLVTFFQLVQMAKRIGTGRAPAAIRILAAIQCHKRKLVFFAFPTM